MYRIRYGTLLFLIFTACSNEYNTKLISTVLENNVYHPTVLPNDTTKLWIRDGIQQKDTVLIVGEGGPKGNLDFETSGRVYWEYLPNFKEYTTVILHQSSTYNKSIFGATNFTLKDARKEVDNSAEILFRTIKYFKDKNKFVVVFGHSYSAWIIPKYLSTRASLADKYIITGGRLDADSIQTALQLKGINSGFNEDGKTLIIPKEDEKPNLYRTERYFTIRKNKELLKYAIGEPRYTKELANKKLSNLIFFYGKKDENVGTLSDAEISFLKLKNAQVIGVETDHYNIWKRVIDKFRDGKIKF